MVAVVGLTAAVVILADDQDEVSNPTAAKPLESVNQPVGARYDGGPEESARGLGSLAAPSAPIGETPASARFLRRGRG